MVVEEKSAQAQDLQTGVDRILQSEEFRNSEVVRRLLIYLTEKAVSGSADNMKEYTVAIEALGKPSSYDPQHNSTVRIQVGRLRQKLAEYYRNEGKDDDIIVSLPKGRFRLTCEHRPRVEEIPLATSAVLPPLPAVASNSTKNELPIRAILLGLSAGLVLSICVALIWHLVGDSNKGRSDTVWTPEIEDLWAPFVTSQRPLILSIEDPLFVRCDQTPASIIAIAR